MTDWWVWAAGIPFAITCIIGIVLLAGYEPSGWGMTLLAIGAFGVIIVLCIGSSLWFTRRVCAQEGSEYATVSHYRALSDTCYLRLADGSFAPDGQFTTLRFGQLDGVK